jgi:SMI1 / KNR4 family (SUKH-1)
MAFAGSEDLVAAAEATLGRRLPKAHRQRLIRRNGGEVEVAGESWTLYPVWDATDRKTVARTAAHIIRENEVLRREWQDVLPPGVIAIADNGGGDLLVLEPETETVLLWDHETGRLQPVTVSW